MPDILPRIPPAWDRRTSISLPSKAHYTCEGKTSNPVSETQSGAKPHKVTVDLLWCRAGRITAVIRFARWRDPVFVLVIQKHLDTAKSRSVVSTTLLIDSDFSCSTIPRPKRKHIQTIWRRLASELPWFLWQHVSVDLKTPSSKINSLVQKAVCIINR